MTPRQRPVARGRRNLKLSGRATVTEAQHRDWQGSPADSESERPAGRRRAGSHHHDDCRLAAAPAGGGPRPGGPLALRLIIIIILARALAVPVTGDWHHDASASASDHR